MIRQGQVPPDAMVFDGVISARNPARPAFGFDKVDWDGYSRPTLHPLRDSASDRQRFPKAPLSSSPASSRWAAIGPVWRRVRAGRIAADSMRLRPESGGGGRDRRTRLPLRPLRRAVVRVSASMCHTGMHRASLILKRPILARAEKGPSPLILRNDVRISIYG